MGQLIDNDIVGRGVGVVRGLTGDDASEFTFVDPTVLSETFIVNALLLLDLWVRSTFSKKLE